MIQSVFESIGIFSRLSGLLRQGFESIGLPAVTEELIGEGIRSQGQMLQEPELSEASTPNFGTTARTLSAAQDFSKSNSTKSRQKRDMGNAEAIHNPASTIATERSVPKTTGSRISNTS